MRRIVVAPCSPFSVSRELMRDSALLARDHGVSLHTHLAENDNDLAYTREKFGCTPAEYAEQLGWVGPDVWCAHCVKLDAAGIQLFAHTHTGVAWYADKAAWSAASPFVSTTVHLTFRSAMSRVLHHILEHTAQDLLRLLDIGETVPHTLLAPANDGLSHAQVNLTACGVGERGDRCR